MSKIISPRSTLIGLIFILLILPFAQHPLFFRDFSIIWEGAFRLVHGQKPYRDFGLPIGPVALWIPALIFHVRGYDFDSLLWAGTIINLISLLAFASCLCSLQVSKLNFVLSACVFALYHLSQMKWPWYNSTALACELVALAFILKSYHCRHRFGQIHLGALAAAFLILTCLSKQDYGGLALVLGGTLILGCQVKRLQKYSLVGLVLGGIATLLFFGVRFRHTEFLYWFNYGQPPHTTRLNSNFFPEDAHQYAILVLLLVCFALWIRNWIVNQDQNKHLQILHGVWAIGLIGQSYIVYRTSGLSFLTATFYVGPACSYILAEGSQMPHLQKRILYAIGCILFVVIPPSHGGRVFTLWLQNRSTHFDSQTVREPTKSAKDCGLFAFGHEYLFAQTIQDIQKLRPLMASARKFSCPVLNMTELTPLALQLGYVPCTGLPLWYDPGISLFPREMHRIIESVRQRIYGLVLLQRSLPLDPELDRTYYSVLSRALDESGYHLVQSIVPPAEKSMIKVFAAQELRTQNSAVPVH